MRRPVLQFLQTVFGRYIKHTNKYAKHYMVFVVLILSCMVTESGVARTNDVENTRSADVVTEPRSLDSEWDKYILPGSFVLFGMIVIALQMFISLKVAHLDPPETTRFSVITLIIIIATVLVTSNVSTERLAVVVGFFGTVAGYLLARGESKLSVSSRDQVAETTQAPIDQS